MTEIVTLSTKLFNWEPAKKLFIGFTADLPTPWYNMYTESNHGFILQSEKTGEEVVFIINNVKRKDGSNKSQLDQDVKWWNLRSKKYSINIRIYNSEFGKMSKDDWSLLFNKAAEKFIPDELQEAVTEDDIADVIGPDFFN